ncbi:hypothetical protein ABZ348_15310 [Streptomyces sp. NPDC005963]|uniref:hypothetical protein n=1 Tax=Streptomyces sp. NPDC005963 TaxID=3156721 RepID=UPI0033F0EE80
MVDLASRRTTSPTTPASPTSPATPAGPAGPGSFASSSLTRHLLRGAVGFGGLAGAVLLFPLVGWASLLLVPVGLLALRGCPMCWTMGLIQTLSMGRLRRSCTDGGCALTPAEAPPPAAADRSRQHPPRAAVRGR